MRFAMLSTICVMGLASCDLQPHAELPDGFCAQIDMKGTAADLAPSSGPCAAAKGLSGTNLVCVDFGTVSSLTDQSLARWDFTTNCGSNLEINAGKLQIKNFAGFMGSCSFLLPAINLTDADKQKYQYFTLSIVHSLDLNKQKQTAAVYLGTDLDTQQMWLGTGANPRQTTTVTVAKAALPNGGGTAYQPLLKLASSVAAGGTAQGWQIESIAVNASP